MMRTTITPTSQLCTACRKAVISAAASRAPFSTSVYPAARVARKTVALPVTRPRHLLSEATSFIPRRYASTQGKSNSPSETTQSQKDEQPSPSTPTQPPNYYALFPQTLPQGPPPKGPFHIDVPSLRREFLRLQAASHPDFYHSASNTSSSSADEIALARRRAEAASAHINAAFKTLSNPLLRAQYLLREQYGIDLEGDEAGKEGAPDAELLMTVLEAREVIEEAESEKDLEGVRRENDERIKEAEERLGRALEGGDVEGAKREAVRLRYWVNIEEGVRNWERGKPVVLQH